VLGGLARRHPYDASPSAVNLAGAWGYRRECQPRARLEPAGALPFEGRVVPVPAAWDAYLSAVYGDYRRLPPPDRRRPRHLADIRPEAADPAPTRARAALRGAQVRVLTLVVRAGFAAGALRPPAPAVILATRDARRVAGNLLSIREGLARDHPGVRVRVLGYRTRSGLVGRLVSAAEAAVLGYHLAAARVFVADDWCFPLFAARPRSGTLRVQVWHAAGAFKRFGFSTAGTPSGADEALRRLPMTANFDLALVSSAAAAAPFAEALRLPVERVTSAIGVPRTDAWYDARRNERAVAAIRARYGLPTGRRVLLYAPTFRGDRVADARHPDALDLHELRRAVGDSWIVVQRIHPLAAGAGPVPDDLAGFVVDGSDWPDPNELMLVADLLVTDYSSAVFEFALLGRPVAFFAPDLPEYRRDRGFYLDVPGELPGPVFDTTAALGAWVRDGRFATEPVRAFARRWFDVADGRATRRLLERVVLPALGGAPVRLPPVPPPSERVVLPVPAPPAGETHARAAEPDPEPPRG
jgi:CDP-ribitol ribitolphosphotransferase